LAAEPLRALLEPVASSGIGLTLDLGGLVAIDPIGLGVIVRMLACSGGSAVLITNAPRKIAAFIDRLFPSGQPGLLLLPGSPQHAGAQPAAS
jgi:hypothetical protein